ncbi:BnaC05g01230D [Brassica napus]|uniref:Signal recognition particle receptor subunit beta n=2 Tax=Brassica TaxID=3705 RepID=A0A0D3C748_BRAOL|nr:unnamed protein product [Brassica napus]CDY15244.1 BnaC05g01230D [Brassica napus]
MGTTFGKPFSGLFQETEPRIVFFGLNYSGTSSILHQLKTGDTLSETRNISLWKNYFQQASGFVFVVDSIYRERIEDAKSFIYMVMDEIQGNAPDNAAVLVYSNIHLVPGAMSASEISNKLDLASCEPRIRFFL